MAKNIWLKWLLPWMVVPFGITVAGVANATSETVATATQDTAQEDAAPPTAPTVNKISGRSVRPSITGTWPEGDGNRLTVEVAGKTYELGKNGELTSDGSGNWTLKLGKDLADNTYDVVVIVTDKAGNSSADRGFGEVVVDSSAPAVPTVNNLLTRQRKPVITGAWPSGEAESLSISVASRTYAAGAGDGLVTDGNNWTLRISENLDDGTYNVSAKATSATGSVAVDASEAELTVDATPPAVPTVSNYKSKHPRPLLFGTYPENDAATMAVTFEGETYTMGGSDLLSSDGKGNWSVLTPKDLPPGIYDVKVVVADKAGNQRSDTTTNEVEIVAPGQDKPAQPDAAEQAVSASQCQGLLDEVLSEQQIVFSPGKSKILGKNANLLNRLMAVIRQCGDAKIEIGGHTDWQGSGKSNQVLSERRANAVRDALLARGASADNITAVGYGESQPIANNRTRKGRAANRRTQFKILN
ncbi:Ig-like domain-containing protein [Anderseniella sp. Alg231-50]|uniref:Ig-like domain-containing protein n=1 Tax=Anderseniella sp. Alg231-50 TaxID=1922226 RepID=UPI000D55EC89